MMDDYQKFVREAYMACPDPFCKQYSVRFRKIVMKADYICLFSECNLCGHVITEKIRQEDMTHFAKMYFNANPIGTKFRRFKLGLFYPSELLRTAEAKRQYKKYIFELLKVLRKTIFNYKGKKIKRPQLGSSIEKLLNDTF